LKPYATNDFWKLFIIALSFGYYGIDGIIWSEGNLGVSCNAYRYVMLVKVDGKDTNSVVGALQRHIQSLPHGLMLSLTWDRGTEMAQHQKITLPTDVDIYFCAPQSPWQRGTNENTNRLLRQYFPKKTDLSVHTQTEMDLIAKRLNTRPRKTLGFMTPADKLYEMLR